MTIVQPNVTAGWSESQAGMFELVTGLAADRHLTATGVLNDLEKSATACGRIYRESWQLNERQYQEVRDAIAAWAAGHRITPSHTFDPPPTVVQRWEATCRARWIDTTCLREWAAGRLPFRQCCAGCLRQCIDGLATVDPQLAWSPEVYRAAGLEAPDAA